MPLPNLLLALMQGSHESSLALFAAVGAAAAGGAGCLVPQSHTACRVLGHLVLLRHLQPHLTALPPGQIHAACQPQLPLQFLLPLL